MQKMIAVTDLKLIDTTPRVLDLRLAEALGFAQPVNVRRLIRRNADELARYGDIVSMVEKNKDLRGRGRPGEENWLNEQQALLICMFARTDRAAEVRAEIMGVFMAWRERRSPRVSSIPAIDDFQIDHDGELDTKLRMIEVCRRVHGRRAAQRLWPQLGLPAVDGNIVRAGGDQSANPFPDQVDRFLQGRTERSAGARVQSSELYHSFTEWCQASGENVCSQKAFTMSMDAAGFRRLASNVVWFLDIRLRQMSIRT